MDDFSNPEIADSLEKAFRHLGGHAEGEDLLGESLRAAKAAEKEEAVRQRGACVILGGGSGGGCPSPWAAHGSEAVGRGLESQDER